MRTWMVAAVVLVLALGGALAPAGTVSADSAEWEAPMPKGVAGADGIRCEGYAEQGGHSYRYVNYVGADGGLMSSDPGRERAWQKRYCRQILATDMGRFFAMRGVTLDTANIRVTITRL